MIHSIRVGFWERTPAFFPPLLFLPWRELWSTLHATISNVAARTAPDHTLHQTRAHTLKHVGETNLTPDFILISGRALSVLHADVGSWRCVHRCHLQPEKPTREMGSVGTAQSLNNTGNCFWNLDYANAKNALAQKKTRRESGVISAIAHKPKHVEKTTSRNLHLEVEVSPERWWEISLKGFQPNA